MSPLNKSSLSIQNLSLIPHSYPLSLTPSLLSLLYISANSGVALRRNLKTFVRMKCHAMVLDSSLNSYPTVVCTVYTMFLMAAMRAHCYIQAVAKGHKGQSHRVPLRNAEHVCACVYEAIQFGARLIHTR